MLRRLRASLVLALLSAMPSRVVAQSIVSGVVSSAHDSSAVVGAEVQSIRHHVRTRSDLHGVFHLAADPNDTLMVRAIGFRAVRVPIGPAAMALTVRLVPLAVVLPELVTSAGQREIRLAETPASVTVLDRADIDAAAASGVNQLLRQLPGIQELPGQPSKTTISIRGLDNSRVLLLVDGEPVAGTLIDNRDIGRLSTVAVDRIEVTKGPSAVEFGSDALGGVINLVTAPPSRRVLFEGTARTGQLGRAEATLAASGTTGRFGIRATGGWRQVDRVTGIAAAGSTLERVYDARVDTRFVASDRLTFRGNLQATVERQRWPLGGAANGFIDNRGGQGFIEAVLAALGGTFRARAFAQRYNYEFRQANGLLPIAGTGDSLEQRERVTRLLVAHTNTIGAQTIDAGVQLTARTLVAPQKIDGDSTSDHVAEVFAKDAWAIGSVLAVGGARYTHSSLWGDALNPSVGVAWQVVPTVRLRANVARGFRAPGFKEIRYTFANPGAGYIVVGNPDLVPEKSWSTSVGGAWAATSFLTIDVEGYRNAVTNLIDTRFVEVNTAGLQVYRNINVARARTEGIETSARLLTHGFDVSVGYDYLRARDLASGLTLDRRATHSARARASRKWGVLRGLLTDATVRYTGSAPLIGTAINGAPSIVGEQGALLAIDAQVRLAATRSIEASLGVNNLFNRVPAGYTPAYQRQAYVGVKVRWGGD